MKIIRDAIGLLLFWAITIGFLIVMWSEVEAHEPTFPSILDQLYEQEQHDIQMDMLMRIERNTAPPRTTYQIKQPPVQLQYRTEPAAKYVPPQELPPLEWERIGKEGWCVERTIDHDGIVVYRECKEE